MSDVELHQHYPHYSELPYSMRVLYTVALLVVGMAYLFAGIYLFHTYSGRDGNAMTLSYDDLVIAYTGSGKGSRLESALRGPMSSMLPTEESNALIVWAQSGGDRATYDTHVQPTIGKRCLSCHDGSNPHLANLSGYDNVKKVIEQDTGTDIFTLVRGSHIHLFGISFIFFLMGLVFSHAYLRPVWFKCSVVALPFLSLALDVSSWYLVKLYHPFALVMMAAGMMQGLCFAFMWVVSLYQLWFARTPLPLISKEGRSVPIIG
jgi:hypothetical protein